MASSAGVGYAYTNAWVELSRRALRSNISTLRQRLGRERTFVAVVKANAYGHGLELVARGCERTGQVDWLATAGLEEAAAVRSCGVKLPILVLSYYDPVSDILRHISNVHLPLYSLQQARVLSRRGIAAPLHLKVDTGTSRLGLAPRAVGPFVATLKARHPKLNLAGLWTHYSNAEDDSWVVTKAQREKLAQVLQACHRAGWHPKFVHADCSAAALREPSQLTNVARVGLALYGLWPSSATRLRSRRASLLPVMTWKARVVAVREVPSGTYVGYGRTYRCPRRTRVATLSVGYWDGFRRAYAPGEVLIGGVRRPILGRVCMNLTMVDVTRQPATEVGDEAVLVGRQGKLALSAEQVAARAKTINYEVLTNVNPQLQRRWA